MSIIRMRDEGNARRILVTAVAGTAMAGALAAGSAAHAATSSIIVREGCTGVSGQTSFQPGLLSARARTVVAVLSSTTSGCTDIINGPQAGTGSFTAQLAGTASLGAENFTGTFTINWPASAGLNPSNGTLTVTQSNGAELVAGTITNGAFTGSPMHLAFVITGNTGNGSRNRPVTAQTFVNSQPLQVTQNLG
jgi:hypothetical protein